MKLFDKDGSVNKKFRDNITQDEIAEIFKKFENYCKTNRGKKFKNQMVLRAIDFFQYRIKTNLPKSKRK